MFTGIVLSLSMSVLTVFTTTSSTSQTTTYTRPRTVSLCPQGYTQVTKEKVIVCAKNTNTYITKTIKPTFPDYPLKRNCTPRVGSRAPICLL